MTNKTNEKNPLDRPKRIKSQSKTADYTLLRLPEDEGLFAVMRNPKEYERYTLIPTEKEINAGEKIPSYHRIIHLISPFLNHIDGTEEPSCNCIHWMTKRTRCVHLKKFFELNPHLDPGENPPPPKNLPPEKITLKIKP